MSRRETVWLVAALLGMAAVWAIALALWPTLPARFPTHFDGAGVPDRFSDRTALSWFALPAIGTVIGGLLCALPWMIRPLVLRHPEFVNVPRKSEFVRLEPAVRVAVLEPTGVFLRVLALLVQLILGYIIWGTHAVATSAQTELSPVGLYAPLALIAATIVWGTLATRRAIQRAAGS